MDTFGKWEETVLEKTFDNVNFVSCHAYYHPELQPDGTRDMKSFLASGAIWTVSSTMSPPPSMQPRPG